MNSTLERPTIDRRQDTRCSTHADARLRKQDLLPAAEWPAVIEECGACGLRLRSQVPLHPGEAVFLKVPGEVLPVHAHVVWTRSGASSPHSPEHSWISGCRLDGSSIGRLKLAALPDSGSRLRALRVRWALMILGGIGIVAAVAYTFIKFAQLIGGETNLWRFR
jgi:hypothetical protein